MKTGLDPQRILVTGGAGFIGSATVKALLAAQKEVVVLDNLFSGKLSNLDLSHPNLEFIEGDVLEYPLVYDLAQTCDAILHLAAIASVPYSIEQPIYSFQVNVQGFLHVCEAVRESARNIRLVYASSAAVYGEPEKLPCDDTVDLAYQPLSPYGLQKVEIEQHANLYHRLFNVNSLGLRYFNVYGRNANANYAGVISRYLTSQANNESLFIFGDGAQSRDFIYIDDVVRANLLALESDYAGNLNIATGRAESLLSLIKLIEKLTDKPAKCEFLPAKPGDILSSYGTTTLSEKTIGFQSQVSLMAGIASMTRPESSLS